MFLWSRVLDVLHPRGQRGPVELYPDHHALMLEALSRVRVAELLIREATNPEELDVGRSSLQAGWAEVQQVVRTAKRDRGLPLRPVSETEELHRKLKDFMNHRGEGLRRRVAAGK